MHEEITPTPYDRIATEWRSAHRRFTAKPFLDRMIPLLPPGGTILDLGCGNGLPNAAYLIAKGFHVTGVDESAGQLASVKRRIEQRLIQRLARRAHDARHSRRRTC